MDSTIPRTGLCGRRGGSRVEQYSLGENAEKLRKKAEEKANQKKRRSDRSNGKGGDGVDKDDDAREAAAWLRVIVKRAADVGFDVMLQ